MCTISICILIFIEPISNFQLISMHFNELSFNSLDFIGCHWIFIGFPLIFIGFHWISSDFHWISIDFVLFSIDFNWFSTIFNGFQSISQDFHRISFNFLLISMMCISRSSEVILGVKKGHFEVKTLKHGQMYIICI